MGKNTIKYSIIAGCCLLALIFFAYRYPWQFFAPLRYYQNMRDRPTPKNPTEEADFKILDQIARAHEKTYYDSCYMNVSRKYINITSNECKKIFSNYLFYRFNYNWVAKPDKSVHMAILDLHFVVGVKTENGKIFLYGDVPQKFKNYTYHYDKFGDLLVSEGIKIESYENADLIWKIYWLLTPKDFSRVKRGVRKVSDVQWEFGAKKPEDEGNGYLATLNDKKVIIEWKSLREIWDAQLLQRSREMHDRAMSRYHQK